MNTQYNPSTLIEGNRKRVQASEQPSTFARYNDEVDVLPSGNLQTENQTRMAGQVGARALELMSNPQEAANVDNWMNQFGQSNEGAAFNQAKMNQAMSEQELIQTNKLLGRK